MAKKIWLTLTLVFAILITSLPVQAAENMADSTQAAETMTETADSTQAAETVSETADSTDAAADTQTTPADTAAQTANLNLSSETAVLMDADTGEVLYDKSKDERRYPASITKLMTLLVAVENSSPDDTVTFTETGIRDVTWDSGNIGMQLGEVMTMKDCWYAAIIRSANEVCAQIAETVGGTEAAFIDMMNQKAQELGCTGTHFVNASGLPDENHYTTAYDMALIMQAGLKNKTFRKVVGATDYTIPATNMSAARPLHTHVPLMAKESSLYYEGCIGAKTGHTSEAGDTLVVAATRNGRTLIAVTLKTSDLGINCADTTALFDYGFSLPVSPTPTPTAAPTETPVPTETAAPVPSEAADEVSGGNDTGITEASDTESAEMQTEEKKGVAETLRSLSTTAKLLLGVMAVMAVILAVLLIALHKKEKYR